MPLRGGWEWGGVPTPGGTLRGSDQRGAGPAFPLPNRLGKSAQLPGQALHPQRSPLGWVGPRGCRRDARREQKRQTGGALWDQRSRRRVGGICSAHWDLGSLLSSQANLLPYKALSRPRGSWGHRREGGEIRRGRWEGASRTRGALPTRAQAACWAPRWGPLPSETRGGRHAWAPSVLLSLNHTLPHTHLPTFSSPVGTKHRPLPPPKLHPCIGPTLHNQGLFQHRFFVCLFLLLFFTIVILFYLLVVVSSIFLFLYFFYHSC